MTKTITVYGKECSTQEQILEAVQDEIMYNDTFIDDEGGLMAPSDLDSVHDWLCDTFTDEEYEIFEQILYSNPDVDVEFDTDTGDYGGFGSMGAFMRWKEGY